MGAERAGVGTGLSMAHCGAGKPLLSSPIDGQHGETENILLHLHAMQGWAADRKRIVANWRNGLKSWKKAEAGEGVGESMLQHVPVRRDTGRGRCLLGCCLLPPLLQPWSYGGTPQEAPLTGQMQTEEVPMQPYRAHGAWVNAGDSHPRAPAAFWLEWTGLVALGQSSGARDVARNLYNFNSQHCGLSHFCIKSSQFNGRSCQHQLGGLPHKRPWRLAINHQ